MPSPSAPPPLPPALAAVRPVVAVGTVAWFAGAAVLAAVGVSGVWVWTCVAGGLLGLVGFGVMRLQRAAARRGARSAQRGLH